MHSLTNWHLARSPDYEKNTDFLYPYSEVPYLGEFKLVKLPMSLNFLIDHVDYWGEGRIVSEKHTTGFPKCYNVNHQLKLVSNGPDRDRKIPNRIPVQCYTYCDTSSYIKDNSVITVTVMGAPINNSCAKDIARIVNNDIGKVVVYGFDCDSEDITNLNQELIKKGIFYCPEYKLSDTLKEITLGGNNIRTYTNITEIKDILEMNVTNATYDVAVDITKGLWSSDEHKYVISDIVIKLIDQNKRNVMAYGYKLWHSGSTDIVKECFPSPLKLIFNNESVKIVNEQYNQALKLDANTDSYNDRLAWGDSKFKTSKRVSWKIIPIWEDNSVAFKLYNEDCDMYLKLDVNVIGNGDRKAWGSTNSDEVRHKYYLEPMIKDGKLLFYIINSKYHQGLKLDEHVDRYGDSLLLGNNVNNHEARFRWLIQSL